VKDPYRGNGTDIKLFELAVTRSAASVSLPAIQVLDGDLRRSYVRQGWGGERSRRELLERAARSADRGGQLTFRHGDPEIAKVPGGYIVDDKFVPSTDRSADPERWTGGRPVGPPRHGPPGRVLSVR
jgi:hypothetical protein